MYMLVLALRTEYIVIERRGKKRKKEHREPCLGLSRPFVITGEESDTRCPDGRIRCPSRSSHRSLTHHRCWWLAATLCTPAVTLLRPCTDYL